MKTCLVVQARMASDRMPGKVLRTVLGKPLLEYELERLRRVSAAGELVVATTANAQDQAIVDFCKAKSFLFYRGSEADVLGRVYEAALARSAEAVVRLTADCPLIDPAIVDRVIRFYETHRNDYDYVSNVLTRTYPRGMDCEVLPFGVLREAYLEARLPGEREHVTPFVYRHPERYRLGNVTHVRDESRHRWTVDVEEDFILVEKILSALAPKNLYFTMEDVLGLCRAHPEWQAINRDVKQKAV